LEVVAGDAIRIHTPGALVQGWLDAWVLRGAAGGIEGLAVSGAQAWDLRFERV
jgi:D-aminopeptidase